MKIPIKQILPNPDQPRTIFDQAELEGLSQSIKENGVIQPIVVEKAADSYIIVDGERRWRASQMAGMDTIEAIVRPASNHNGTERLTHALVANIQRSAMGPIDEARAFEKLVHELGTAEAVAKKVGVSTTQIYTKLTLLEFPEQVQKLFNMGKLPLIGSIIFALKHLDVEQQVKVATRAAIRGWSGKTIMKLITMEAKHTGKSKAYIPIKRAKKEITFNGHFNALALINSKELPDHIRAAAIQTCQACSLYPEASPAICKECPLPDFLRRL